MRARRRPERPVDRLEQVRGLRVGHAESPDGRSGVSVVLFEAAAPTVVDLRGGASCSFDTGSLALDATFGRRWAIFFTGGSVYGLDAARGVRVRVLENGGGHTVFRNPNPVAPISGAALFDLPAEVGPVPDYLPLGYEAARVADRSGSRRGRVGAGAGAYVGKYLGRARAMPGGLASASELVPGLGRVGVLAVVNAIGAVRDPSDGRWRAGARGRDGRIVPPTSRTPTADRGASTGTTLVLGVVEARLERRHLQRIAAQVHAALARTIEPVHSALDGDVVFVSSTEVVEPAPPRPLAELPSERLGFAAGRCTERAVLRAVTPGPDGEARARSAAVGEVRRADPAEGRSSSRSPGARPVG